MSEDRVLQALKALAENDHDREAPPTVEARLLRQFHARRTSHKWRWAGIAAIAAGVVLAVLLSMNRSPKPVARTAAPAVQIPQEAALPVAPVAPPAPRKAARKMARPEAREVVTDFFPLMDPAPPFERGQMLRVQLPAAAMRTVGLPVREDHLADPIQADVLVGEEGMPRAIRFVRFDVP
jgi:hypothetical protein